MKLKPIFLAMLLATAFLTSCGNKEKVAVLYYSWGGNTESVARFIAKKTGADLLKVEPQTPYPEDFAACVQMAAPQYEENVTVPLVEQYDLSEYDVVFVGSPIWMGTLAIPMRSFLRNDALAGKKVIPFATHGSGGAQGAFAEIISLCPDAKVLKSFAAFDKEGAMMPREDFTVLVSNFEDAAQQWLEELGW